ncbi:hypothetical protein [Streptomyces katrae]|uniref:hypothetical protein n=1 Tax=Streptomyces katrae TaxID=68223 RepID=UPI0004C1325A|nr:hypothetical protein [Streptomyces katrae]
MPDKRPANTYYAVAAGDRYCLLTSDKRIAYLKATEVRPHKNLDLREITSATTVWMVPGLPPSDTE